MARVAGSLGFIFVSVFSSAPDIGDAGMTIESIDTLLEAMAGCEVIDEDGAVDPPRARQQVPPG